MRLFWCAGILFRQNFFLFFSGFENIKVAFGGNLVKDGFDNLVNLPILAIICRQGKINPVIGQKLNGRFFVLALRAINRNRRSAAFFGDFHGRNVSHAVAEINHSPVRDPPFFVRHKFVYRPVFQFAESFVDFGKILGLGGIVDNPGPAKPAFRLRQKQSCSRKRP